MFYCAFRVFLVVCVGDDAALLCLFIIGAWLVGYFNMWDLGPFVQYYVAQFRIRSLIAFGLLSWLLYVQDVDGFFCGVPCVPARRDFILPFRSYAYVACFLI